jgi:hypothetical protein
VLGMGTFEEYTQLYGNIVPVTRAKHWTSLFWNYNINWEEKKGVNIEKYVENNYT